MLTGQGDEQLAVALMKAGATDYMSKSAMSPERLAQVLRYAIRVRRAELHAEQAQQALQRAAQESAFLPKPAASWFHRWIIPPRCPAWPSCPRRRWRTAALSIW